MLVSHSLKRAEKCGLENSFLDDEFAVNCVSMINESNTPIDFSIFPVKSCTLRSLKQD